MVQVYANYTVFVCGNVVVENYKGTDNKIHWQIKLIGLNGHPFPAGYIFDMETGRSSVSTLSLNYARTTKESVWESVKEIVEYIKFHKGNNVSPETLAVDMQIESEKRALADEIAALKKKYAERVSKLEAKKSDILAEEERVRNLLVTLC